MPVKTKKRISTTRKIILSACVLLLAAMIFAVGFYLLTYDHASDTAEAAAADAVQVELGGREVWLFEPDEASGAPALIFYPGGKVQPEAYAPLCRALADRGILCALVKMPCNLAVFDSKAAAPVIEYIADTFGCEEFYIGGHSLGGVMAARYAYANTESLCGVVLLAAYPANDLNGTGLRVLSVYGTEDGVLNAARYAEALAYMPADFTELILDGGCHSYFGDYGMQKGDGTPTVSREEQLTQTADSIAQWMENAA